MVFYIGRVISSEVNGFDNQIRTFINAQHINQNEYSSNDSIQYVQGSKENLKSNLIIEITPVWKQSKINDCDVPLTFESAKNKNLGALSIKVTCSSTNWKMYVPVYVGKIEEVIVLNNNIERGKEISNSDLKVTSLDVGKLTKGYFTNKEQLKEKKSVRHLQAGQILNPLMIDDIDLVFKGDSVLITVIRGELKVQMYGIALASGERGKQISVRNRSSDRIVKAVIKEKGLVEIII